MIEKTFDELIKEGVKVTPREFDSSEQLLRAVTSGEIRDGETVVLDEREKDAKKFANKLKLGLALRGIKIGKDGRAFIDELVKDELSHKTTKEKEVKK